MCPAPRVRTHNGYPYGLPKGLRSGVEVTVVSYDLKTYNHVARDAAGQEWTIKTLQNLDAGSEYMLGGRWLLHAEAVKDMLMQALEG